MTKQSWKQRKSQAVSNGISVMCDFYIDRAENASLWDEEGRKYIDFAAGIAVTNTGHRHPRVVAAIARQLDKFTHTAFQVAPYGSYIDLAEKINQLTPGDHAKKTAFFTTGAEAVENAVKIARCATGRSGVIAFSGAFHGRTFMGMALTGKVHPYKASFGPMPAEVYHVPFPSALHGISTEDSLSAINHLFKADIDPGRVAAILIEPIQGEGGFNVAPPELLKALRSVCDQHGIVLIVDEVQTGFARTGKMFAIEHSEVIPDLITMAKSLAGGMPLSAVCGRAELMDAPPAGALGGTYAGNPLALAAAHAVLEIIETEGLTQRACVLGDRLRETLISLKKITPAIAEVRGLGAMIAVEFQHPETGEPDAAFAREVQAKCLEQGLILLTCGTYANVIRFLFPLTIEDALLTQGLHILSTAIRV